MENMAGCQSRVEALRRRARAQVDVLLPLNELFAQEAEHLRRHDQARSLEALGRKIAQEVSVIQRTETAASYGFNQAALITGLVKFGIGGLEALASRNGEHPLSAGARLAEGDFTRTAPFGEVRVAVGIQGIPADEIRGLISALKKAKRVRLAFEPNGIADHNNLVIETEAIRYRWASEAGSFPDYEKLIPAEAQTEARFDTRELMRAGMAVASLGVAKDTTIRRDGLPLAYAVDLSAADGT